MTTENKLLLTPSDILEKLEFDRILERLATYCHGDLAVERALSLFPSSDFKGIQLSLEETDECLSGISEGEVFPMSKYSPLEEDLRFLALEESVLTEEAMVRIHQTLHLMDRIVRFFSPERKHRYKKLGSLVERVPHEPALSKAIRKVLDEEGNIREDASETLQRIRRKKNSLAIDLDRVFKKLITEYRKKGYLADSVESVRNGRRVFTIASEHKRKIHGIIHDESATGKTAFIEPEPILKINNDLFDLDTEERKEIYRILKSLSALLRPHIELISDSLKTLIKLDMIQAKAHFASAYKGVAPKFKDLPRIGWKEAYHPLLLLKNFEEKKETVPFDLDLRGSNKMVVLSGPNAGGKSVTMKSVGLLQMMLQSGMLVPCDPDSEIGLFKKLCADIGDQQSLEDDLSTYSSRLKNMKEFLEVCDETSLVLIDEFGSGTDPKIGGAIAESILRSLHHKKVFGLITTHYPNLKIFAFKTRGILNASMTFDKKDLKPTYELKVGTPGSSYAFEIAQNSGLGKEILQYARKRVGKNERAVDQLLIDLQRESQELKEELKKVEGKEKKLSQLIKNYEQLFKDMEFRRKKMKLEAKQQNLQQVA
ncbi:MAG: endonuclease MutS2, partial [Saprospiraceae bacterium]|nr:endonuclease MutS2 [Saprospiraceae bacterium]